MANYNEHSRTADPEDSWDGTVDGVPEMSDPFIQAYLHGRDALILEEQKLRSGS
jgi:hypothetical protein